MQNWAKAATAGVVMQFLAAVVLAATFSAPEPEFAGMFFGLLLGALGGYLLLVAVIAVGVRLGLQDTSGMSLYPPTDSSSAAHNAAQGVRSAPEPPSTAPSSKDDPEAPRQAQAPRQPPLRPPAVLRGVDVFSLLDRHRTASSKEIAKVTGAGRFEVREHLFGLINAGLVQETSPNVFSLTEEGRRAVEEQQGDDVP